MRRVNALIVVLTLPCLVLAGCSNDRTPDARALEAAFPVLAELGVRSLHFGGDLDGDFGGCARVVYERGLLATDQECGTVISRGAEVRPFDDRARQDVRRIALAADPSRPIQYAHVSYAPDGSVTGAALSFDFGDFYVYSPGYDAVPPDVDSLRYEAIDDNWYVELTGPG